MPNVWKDEPPHVSGHLHVTGQSLFIGDAPKPQNMLIAKPVPSAHAHAKVLSIDTTEALALEGVVAVLTADDIPGANNVGHFTDVEPLLANETVVYIGQPVAVVVATSRAIAKEAVKHVKVTYEPLEPLLSFDQAIVQKSFYLPPRKIERGDIAKGFADADYVLEGEAATGAKEHMYFETQRCWAFPEENNCMTIYPSGQNTAAVQKTVARILGVDAKAVTVDIKRIGGGFGGKEEAPNLWSSLAALAAHVTQRPVELKLNRQQDIGWTGKRHPYQGKYKVGFNKDGKIMAYDLALYSNGGALVDLSIPVLERSMLFGENAYYIPNIRITGAACRTNMPPNTAFRGFGGPQAVFMIESAMHAVARHLQKDTMEVREINLYENGQTTPYEQPLEDVCLRDIFARLRENSQYAALRKETDAFNAKHNDKKRGMGVVPIKFGLSFTQNTLNQGSSLMWVYTDGSVSVSHGGIEMGQGLNTKVAQVAAQTLGVSLDKVRVESTNTKRIGNTSPTAASTGADLNCSAVRAAALAIQERLKLVAVDMLKAKGIDAAIERIVFADNKVFDRDEPSVKLDFSAVTEDANFVHVIDLGEHAFYKTPGVQFNRETGRGTPFYYFVQGACLCQVEVDLLSGRHRLLRVHIVHETGHSLNKGVDTGQISGAFFQGYGMFALESLHCNDKGRYVEDAFSTYKIPSIRELPEVFDIDLYEHDCVRASVLGSKGIGEPPLLYGEAAYFAVKDALEYLVSYRRVIDLPNPVVPSVVLAAITAIREEKAL